MSMMPMVAICQFDEPVFDEGDPDAEQVPVPIDDGVVCLIIAGVGYGVKLAYDQKKKANNTTDPKQALMYN
jgi:hypothetical protein